MAGSPKTGDMELGQKIATRREELGMSRKQLAEAAGLSYPYIAQIETGYRLPSTKHHLVLAGVLGMSLDELFGNMENAGGEAPLVRARTSRRRPTVEEAINHAVREIESLPASARLEALSHVQLRGMQGMTGD